MLLGFTFFMGLMLSRLMAVVLGLEQRRQPDHDGLRRHRRLIFFGMATLSTVIKRDLSSMGKFLFVGAHHAAGGGHRQLLRPVAAR